MKDDTLLILGALGIGAVVLYKPLQSTGNAISDTVSGVGQGATQVASGVGTAVQGTGEAISELAQGTTEAVNTVTSNLSNITAPAGSLGSGASTLIENAFDNIQNPDSAFRENVSNIIEAPKNLITYTVDKVKDTATNAINIFKDLVSNDKSLKVPVVEAKPKEYNILPVDGYSSAFDPDPFAVYNTFVDSKGTISNTTNTSKSTSKSLKDPVVVTNESPKITAGSLGVTGEQIAAALSKGIDIDTIIPKQTTTTTTTTTTKSKNLKSSYGESRRIASAGRYI